MVPEEGSSSYMYSLSPGALRGTLAEDLSVPWSTERGSRGRLVCFLVVCFLANSNGCQEKASMCLCGLSPGVLKSVLRMSPDVQVHGYHRSSHGYHRLILFFKFFSIMFYGYMAMDTHIALANTKCTLRLVE